VVDGVVQMGRQGQCDAFLGRQHATGGGRGSEEEEEEEVGRKVKTFAKTKVVNMENGKWKNGKWKMENGKWKMENVNEHVYQ
jgi:hypothetical protein